MGQSPESNGRRLGSASRQSQLGNGVFQIDANLRLVFDARHLLGLANLDIALVLDVSALGQRKKKDLTP